MDKVVYESPVGELLLVVVCNKLCVCDWIANNRAEKTLDRMQKYLSELRYKENFDKVQDNALLLKKTISQLDEYFSGKRYKFELPLLLVGTEFQQEVWNSLLQIGFGDTLSYKKLAQSVGKPKAVRAVANAVGANPLSIVVPCHRIIGSDGSLTGYAGGLDVKTALLNLEKRNCKL